MRRAWIVAACFVMGCFSEPGVPPDGLDAGDSDLAEIADVAEEIDGGLEMGPTGGLTAVIDGSARVRPGDSVDIMVTLTRDGVEGDVTLEGVGLPSGVTITSEGIASGASDGILTVSATTAAVIGGPYAATLRATTGDSDAIAPLWIVVAGEAGSADSSFGTNGSVRPPAAAGDDTVDGLALDEQGRSLVAGRSASASTTGFVLALGVGGGLDDGFGDEGMFTDFGGTSSNVVGGAFVGGFVLNARIDGTPTLLRLTASGTVDDTWGTAPLAAGAQGPIRSNSQLVLWAGSTIYTFADTGPPTELEAPAEIADLAVDDAGRFVIAEAGTTVVTRLTPDGVDLNFGASGSLELGGNLTLRSVSASPTGGFAAAAGPSDSIITHFDDTGQPMLDFGTDGTISLGTDEPQSLLAVGTTIFVVVDRASTPVVVRYRADGTRDFGFGSGGEIALDGATGTVHLLHDDVSGRLLIAFPTGTAVEVQRWWL